MKKAIEIAEFFLTMLDLSAGDTMSNLQLQKLLYFAQGFSLAINDKPIFEEDIEAWISGPVVPTVFHAYQKYNNQSLPMPKFLDFDRFSKEENELLLEVFNVYGQFSAWKLRDISYIPEGPWKKTFVVGKNNVIPHKVLKKYFLTQITVEE